ncbi:MAG TPA: hypothetical protein VFS09_12525 [Candidatus Eisenbacteria bacterium]|nr:hypothetical protein [Candidatus Eisenbacteria bacterium]
MRLLFAVLFVWSSAVSVPAFAEVPCSSPPESSACPDSIRGKGIAALRARVGAERADPWFTARPDCCRPFTRRSLDGPVPLELGESVRALGGAIGDDQLLGWRLEFDRAIPKAPWAGGKTYVFVDTLGAPLGFWGVDSCAVHPERCWFSLDFEGARKLARVFGLEPGIAPWAISFAWEPERQRFVWIVRNTLEMEAGKPDRAGRELYIDANSRLLLAEQRWVTTGE